MLLVSINVLVFYCFLINGYTREFNVEPHTQCGQTFCEKFDGYPIDNITRLVVDNSLYIQQAKNYEIDQSLGELKAIKKSLCDCKLRPMTPLVGLNVYNKPRFIVNIGQDYAQKFQSCSKNLTTIEEFRNTPCSEIKPKDYSYTSMCYPKYQNVLLNVVKDEQLYLDEFLVITVYTCVFVPNCLYEMTEPLTNTAYYMARWKDISLQCNSFEEFQRKVENYETDFKILEHVDADDKFPLSSHSLKNDIFPYLLPAIEATLVYVCDKRLLIRNHTIFNGIDNIVEILWNHIEIEHNEAHEWLNIFEMDWCKKYLAENPRPIYPLSCMITKDEAATIIQSFYRGYLIRKIPQIQRFRKFWARIKDGRRRRIPPTPVSSEASLLKRCVKCFPKKIVSKSCSTDSLLEATKIAIDKENKKVAFKKKCRFISEPAIMEMPENTCTKNLKF